jgi:hypothetical protein
MRLFSVSWRVSCRRCPCWVARCCKSRAIQLLALGPLDGFKDVLPQPFASDGAVIAFDIGVLLRLAWLDVFEPDTSLLSPCHERFVGIEGSTMGQVFHGRYSPRRTPFFVPRCTKFDEMSKGVLRLDLLVTAPGPPFLFEMPWIPTRRCGPRIFVSIGGQ